MRKISEIKEWINKWIKNARDDNDNVLGKYLKSITQNVRNNDNLWGSYLKYVINK